MRTNSSELGGCFPGKLLQTLLYFQQEQGWDIEEAGISSQMKLGALFLRLVCHMQHLLESGRKAGRLWPSAVSVLGGVNPSHLQSPQGLLGTVRVWCCRFFEAFLGTNTSFSLNWLLILHPVRKLTQRAVVLQFIIFYNRLQWKQWIAAS